MPSGLKINKISIKVEGKQLIKAVKNKIGKVYANDLMADGII